MKKSILLVSIASLLILSSCDLPHEPGPMPSDIIETQFDPGLNVFGILRADGQAGTSIIHINRALTTEEIYSDSIEHFSPELQQLKVSSVSTGQDYLFLEIDDASRAGEYEDTSLVVKTGETYNLEIVATGYPTLTGKTQVPHEPQLVSNSLTSTSSQLSFQIVQHSSAYQYQAYIIFAETVLEKTIELSDEGIISIEWEYSGTNGDPMYLILSALDENLTRYGNSPISFLPNTYHTDGSTVSGGYGCFGSVSILTIELQ